MLLPQGVRQIDDLQQVSVVVGLHFYVRSPPSLAYHIQSTERTRAQEPLICGSFIQTLVAIRFRIKMSSNSIIRLWSETQLNAPSCETNTTINHCLCKRISTEKITLIDCARHREQTIKLSFSYRSGHLECYHCSIRQSVRQRGGDLFTALSQISTNSAVYNAAKSRLLRVRDKKTNSAHTQTINIEQ